MSLVRVVCFQVQVSASRGILPSAVRSISVIAKSREVMTRNRVKAPKEKGLFIMYSGITKIYYRKTVGHVFTKPVQTERTTQNFFFPSLSCFSSYLTFLPLGCASVCSEKMAAPGEKSFCVLEYHTSKSVVTVQRAYRAKYAKVFVPPLP